MTRSGWLATLTLLILAACSEPPLIAVGLLQSDRIELVAEFSEAIVNINASEGDTVAKGELLLSQNAERAEIQITEATANIARLESALNEQLNGPRPERISAARARLSQSEIEERFARREFERLTELRDKNLTSVESLDNAEKVLASANAAVQLANAELDELLAGTRVEQIEQSRFQLQQLRSQLALRELEKDRHNIYSTVNGVLDSLPFKAGEKPAPGAVVAIVLAGEQPYARVYVPEQIRLSIRPGQQLQLKIDGMENILSTTVRRISSDASFTPYYALTERDRSRLSYVAELTLPELSVRLPDGVPVQVSFDGIGTDNE